MYTESRHVVMRGLRGQHAPPQSLICATRRCGHDANGERTLCDTRMKVLEKGLQKLKEYVMGFKVEIDMFKDEVRSGLDAVAKRMMMTLLGDGRAQGGRPLLELICY